MNTKKRIDGDYYIQTINPDDRVYIDTDTVEVDGNLVVNGNLTYINTEQLNVKDPFIMVNSSNTATYSANSGVLTHKTASTYAGIRYSADDNQWQISINTGTNGPIQLADQSSVPAAVATTTVLYANVAGSGGTGVYFVDGAITDELVSKSKAIVYGIIF